MNDNYVEIDLLDLLKEVLKKWKIIVACMLICAIAGGIFGVVSSKKAKLTTDEELNALKVGMTQEEITGAEDAAKIINAYRVKFNSQKEYSTNSIYQNLDPYAINTVVLSYYVDVEDKDKTLPIVQTYAMSLKNEDLYKKFAEDIKSDLKPLYYQELVTVDYGNKEDSKSEEDSGLLVVTIYADSDELLSSLSTFVKEEINNKTADVSSIYGSHNLVFSSESKSITVDQDVASAQQDNMKMLTDITTAITNTEKNFSGNQLNYLKYLVHEEVEEETSAVKYIAIGLVLGLLIPAAYYCAKYLIAGTAKTEEELKAIVASDVIGSTKDDINLLATKIDFYADKTKSKTIALVSYSNDEKFFELLKKEVKKAKLVFVSNPSKDKDAYGKLVSADTAVVLEGLKVSKRTDVTERVNVCKETNTEILGIIID